jgi:hypothetical protein
MTFAVIIAENARPGQRLDTTVLATYSRFEGADKRTQCRRTREE